MPTTQATITSRRQAATASPNFLGAEAVKNISGCLNALLADYHLLLDEQADQLSGMTDDIAERVRKIGGATLGSIGRIARLQRISGNDAGYVDPLDMLAESREGNRSLLASMRAAHDLCDEENDVATTSLLEVWIEEAERRIWLLFETGLTR